MLGYSILHLPKGLILRQAYLYFNNFEMVWTDAPSAYYFDKRRSAPPPLPRRLFNVESQLPSYLGVRSSKQHGKWRGTL